MYIFEAVAVHTREHSVTETRQSKAATPEDNSREKEELPQAGLEHNLGVWGELVP